MFTYAVDYEELVLSYGAAPCIAWVNEIYQQLDGCISALRSASRHGDAFLGPQSTRVHGPRSTA